MVNANDIQYTQVPEPFWGLPKEMPRIPDSVYCNRLQKLLTKMQERNLDFIFIYADREHYGNFDYLVGYGPRFEEALLIINKEGDSWTLLGNECLGMANYSRIPTEKILFQSFSLPNQPIDKLKSLDQVLIQIGLLSTHKVGLVGWKLMYPNYGNAFESDIPSFITDRIREVVGKEQAMNVTDLFIDPESGIRVINDAHEIAYFEYGATYASDSAQQILINARTGLTEVELSQFATYGALPTSAFPKVISGNRLDMGMVSPTTNKIKLGERFQVTMALLGGLTCRKGFAAYTEADLVSEARDYMERFMKPYFALVCNWYEMMEVGTNCGNIYNMVEATFPKAQYGWYLNPGHLIAIEEWLSSPIYKDSPTTIKSGMCLQMDIIPSVPSAYASPNCEDGIAIADEKLRGEIKELYPDVYERMENRRNFMRDVLNIQVKPEVLPLSNLAGLYRPFVLNKDMALTVKK